MAFARMSIFACAWVPQITSVESPVILVKHVDGPDHEQFYPYLKLPQCPRWNGSWQCLQLQGFCCPAAAAAAAAVARAPAHVAAAAPADLLGPPSLCTFPRQHAGFPCTAQSLPQFLTLVLLRMP